ncbi:cytochrome c [Hydrogenophaga sp.]|uniref:c-type cytochrome n=1 Tax=Hydrogenophaga sp. TaxID=1904254 RepID=UPI002730BAB2|nr:cytochrome c [Hydrogenophaga sp.]MDP1687886.1 cytochrome c [Hydrogenophaga sp.]
MRIPLLLAATLSVAAAHAADPALGRTKASMVCAVCHGPTGMSMMPNAPHLAGQPAIYLVEQLKNYRSGKRAHEVMAVIAKPLTDAEIEDLAAWYASLQISVQAP